MCMQVAELKGGDVQVCVLCVAGGGAPGEGVVATGLEDGSVKLWDIGRETTTVTLR